jgi:ribosomal protein L29
MMGKQMTIAELAAYERELMAELARVRVQISERAGQVDPEPPKKSARK